MTATIVPFPGSPRAQKPASNAPEQVANLDTLIDGLLDDLVPRLAALHAADRRTNTRCKF